MKKSRKHFLPNQLTDFYDRHLKICETCEYRKVDAKGIERCGACGCRLKMRVWTTCPKRKW